MVLVLRLGGQTLLEEVLEVFVPIEIETGVAFGLFLEHLEDASHQDSFEFGDQGRVLVVFSGDVERQVFTVHHALHEPQPARQNLFAVGLDQDFLAIETHFGLLLLHAVLFGVGGRDIEQGFEHQRHVGRVVQFVLVVELGLGDVLVELVVLVLADLPFVSHPESAHSLKLLAVEVQIMVEEAGVFVDDFLDFFLVAELHHTGSQMDHDLGASHDLVGFKLLLG